jgi:hypothetical protein
MVVPDDSRLNDTGVIENLSNRMLVASELWQCMVLVTATLLVEKSCRHLWQTNAGTIGKLQRGPEAKNEDRYRIARVYEALSSI